MLKKTLFALYILTVVCMGLTTIIEKYKGTQYTTDHIYGTWWFAAMWGALAAAAIFHFIRQRVRNVCVTVLHLSFIIILAGALLTHITSIKGVVHLRQGEPTKTYMVLTGDEVKEYPLPFQMSMDAFETRYYEGTKAASDYETTFTITDESGTHTGKVSMNNIYSHRSFRFYQNNYDEDMRGSILSINSDPWGIPVTYSGYALLFIALAWMLADPKGTYRKLLRNPLLKKGVLSLCLTCAFPHCADAAPALPRETAAKFGELNILYNDRICPLQTFAIDFTKKIYGASDYDGLTAEQVLTGWIFWPDEWSDEPFIKVKGGAMKEAMQLPDYMSVNKFFNSDMGGYIIGPYIREYYHGNHDRFHRQAADTDDKIQLIMELRRGTLLKVFPHTHNGKTTWYAPNDQIPQNIGAGHRIFIEKVFLLLGEEAHTGNHMRIGEITDKIIRYQKENGGGSLPTAIQTKAERLYNSFPFATVLFMVNLTLGLITLSRHIYTLTCPQRKDSSHGIPAKISQYGGITAMALSFASLTLCESLRWIISGNVPMANGYETMLFVAWAVMLMSMIAYRHFRIALTFGFLMSGFFLLVSHIGQMDPNITNIMPVLNSPLLSVHVSVIMLAFALLSLTFICGITALILYAIHSSRGTTTVAAGQAEALQLLSRLFLYPALTTLGIGIFIGAIWANVSWGQYWGWDPKEVWALITFMVYAIAVHTGTVPAMRNPLHYHIFMTAAFLTILMTYFGVNYFLGGMHSYA